MARIGLDYGHGSNTFPPDKGLYKNGKGYEEHSFNSKLGLKLKKKLQDHGHTIIEGQKANSIETPLRRRTDLYNRKNVDIVFSVHANASSNKSVDGRCAFYWHTSSNGKRLAQSVINEIKDLGYSLHGNGLHASKRGSWTNLHITRETSAPAVLVEFGFMTNNKDFDLIFGNKQEEYTEAMAEASLRAIQSYFGQSVQATYVAPPFEKPDPEDLPDVRSFSDYPRIVEITKDVNAYNYPNLYDYNKTLSKGTELKVYGETYGTWAGGGGVYFTKKNAKELPQTIRTGGLTTANVDEMERYFRDKQLRGAIRFVGEGKNPHALVTLKGDAYENFRRWLDEKGWWHEIVS